MVSLSVPMPSAHGTERLPVVIAIQSPLWVEFLWDAPHRTRVVDFATASRNGEPYTALIDRKGFVPSQGIRYCTGFLKRDRIEAFARHRLGLKRWHAVIGLRADEQRRVLRMRAMNCGSRTGAHAVLPLADVGVREPDVLDWWRRQPFDLGIPSYAGNCACCFLKGRAKLIRIIREDGRIALQSKTTAYKPGTQALGIPVAAAPLPCAGTAPAGMGMMSREPPRQPRGRSPAHAKRPISQARPGAPSVG